MQKMRNSKCKKCKIMNEKTHNYFIQNHRVYKKECWNVMPPT
jgi:hypothetical protein